MLSFSRTLLKYNLAQDLHFQCRFDDLDFVSRSQVCQKHEQQIVGFIFFIRFLSTVV